MGVKVREKVKGSGEWWLFIDNRGRRKARRVGIGKSGKKAAELAALKISARRAEGDTSPLDPAPVVAPLTLAAFAATWLAQHAEQVCKGTFSDGPSRSHAGCSPRARVRPVGTSPRPRC